LLNVLQTFHPASGKRCAGNFPSKPYAFTPLTDNLSSSFALVFIELELFAYPDAAGDPGMKYYFQLIWGLDSTTPLLSMTRNE
jgi:hypothetical protein